MYIFIVVWPVLSTWAAPSPSQEDPTTPKTRVSEYNEAVWVRDLPPLQQERWTNGCCYYNNEEETKVTIDINYSPIIIQSGS